jgi:hypothetical protein
LCGLRVDVHLAWTGGYSYLHKKVPIYMMGYADGLYNYAIVAAGSPGVSVAKDGAFELHRVGEKCADNPSYSWHLP